MMIHQEMLENLIAEEQPPLVALQLGMKASAIGPIEDAVDFIATNISHWIKSGDVGRRKPYAANMMEFSRHTRKVIVDYGHNAREILPGIIDKDTNNIVYRYHHEICGRMNQAVSYQVTVAQQEYKDAEAESLHYRKQYKKDSEDLSFTTKALLDQYQKHKAEQEATRDFCDGFSKQHIFPVLFPFLDLVEEVNERQIRQAACGDGWLKSILDNTKPPEFVL